jgi:two-component sensor histidine kinase
MQVIMAMINIQSQNIEDENVLQMFKETMNRIHTMALVHEKLYQTKNLADVDFKKYVKSLVTSLFRSYGTRPDKITLKIEVEDVSLGLESAIPCGLIINELVSNSLKYAFPEERTGGIRVALNSINGDELVLEVSDNGIGISEDLDVRNAESMGLHLVTILSEDQLHGKIELSRTGGTNFHVQFKKHTYKTRI